MLGDVLDERTDTGEVLQSDALGLQALDLIPYLGNEQITHYRHRHQHEDADKKKFDRIAQPVQYRHAWCKYRVHS